MEYAIWIFVGMAVNTLITLLMCKVHYRKEGVLQIDHSNPEKDVYRFVIDNIDDLSKKKYIVLKVDNNADLSQK